MQPLDLGQVWDSIVDLGGRLRGVTASQSYAGGNF
jgi:hypothetical protein